MARQNWFSRIANKVVRGAKSQAGRQARKMLRGKARKAADSGQDRRDKSGKRGRKARKARWGGGPVDYRGSGDAYYMRKDAPLPDFSYKPKKNNRADPGEVVWTWVPFEEDPSEGKDRPVLVLAETREGVIGAQMTSRNRTDYFLPEDRFGRAWFDIGTGSWDSEGRRSEVRLDRLLVIPRGTIRREGGRVDKKTYTDLVSKIRQVHEG